MMMPGVELARKRRIHHRHEVAAAGPSDSSLMARPSSLRPPAQTRMAEPAILARLRLEEKLQGLGIGSQRRNPSSSPSSSPPSPSTTTSTSTPSPVVRQIRHTGGVGNQRVGAVVSPLLNQEAANMSNTIYRVSSMEPIPVPTIKVKSIHKSNSSIHKLLRSNSGLDVCAVCLEEIQVSRQRITWLPCSHKYHSDCVLPWLTAHSHCPCCRTRIPPLSVLSKK